MTLGEIKKFKGQIKLWVKVFQDEGEHFPISKAAFLRSIGGDVPHSDDGLHDDTHIDAFVSSSGKLLVG